jgi:hypothetical protein
MTKSKNEPLSGEAEKFMIRLPGGMRSRIAEEAKANGRSMNAEIVARLQGSLDPELPSLAWGDLVRLLLAEAKKHGASIKITIE